MFLPFFLFILAWKSVSAFVAPSLSSSRETRRRIGNTIAPSAAAASSFATTAESQTHIVIVGAGWAGWGAAKAACEAGAVVTLLDALPDPRTPYLSITGKPVEAGTRGFWKDYPNIQALCKLLQQQQQQQQPFTYFTNSSFYSPDGLEATAPVFSSMSFAINQLPSPLGQVLATFPLFERIPLQDRASMLGLLVATVDCLGNSHDAATQEAYDRMTAHELFLKFGLSDRMVRDFITPTLLVGLFKPPTELSALVVMELLYFYALAHTDSFDVQWIRNGTVASTLLGPLATFLETTYPDSFTFQSLCRVETISVNATTQCVNSITYKSIMMSPSKTKNTTTLIDMDGVVLALTAKGMKSVVSNSPDLAQHSMFRQAAASTGIDVISVRLWLDHYVETRTPANVLSRFEELQGAGGTFFMLDQLQHDNQYELWGNATPQGSVVACDFYNAAGLLHLTNDELVRLLMEDLLPAAVPAFARATTVDSWVGRYPGAVSWFAPGSFSKRPTLHTPVLNMKCAGDWVRLGDREHGAKGLCQERALVTGYEAANAVLRDVSNLEPRVEVLPVREDEAQFRAAVALNQQVMRFLPRFWVR